MPLCVIECSGDNIVSDDFDLVCLHEGHVHKSHFDVTLLKKDENIISPNKNL